MAVTREEVAELYIATFNRAPDSAGLDYWVASGLAIEEIAMSFFDQPETQALYGGTVTDFEEFVNAIYNNLFNRDAESGGLAYWVSELENGNISVGNMILAIVNGAQDTGAGSDATTMANKLVVGLAYADADAAGDLTFYVEDARAVMDGVDYSQGSIDEAMAEIQAIMDNEDSIGSTFVMTTAVDHIIGTEKNDTINGYISDLGGMNNIDTMQVFDVVDGGLGNDTLKIILDNSADITMGSVTNVENITFDMTVNGLEDTQTIDMSLVSDVENITLNAMSATYSNSADINLENLSGNLNTFSIIGQDSDRNTDNSNKDVYINDNSSDAATLSIDKIIVENMFGDGDKEFYQLTNIPVLELTNISRNDSSDITLEVLDSVATGTDDTLTIVADNAGAFTYNEWNTVDIYLDNQSGDGDIFENLDLTVSGDNGFYIDSDDGLKTVTISGTGDTQLWFSSSDAIQTYDASLHSGDLTSSIDSALSVNVTLGDGNHWFGLYEDNSGATALTQTLTAGSGSTWLSLGADDGKADAVVDLGAGNDWVDLYNNNDDTIQLGAGDDVLFADWSVDTDNINADDSINGGADNDTLIVDAAELDADLAAGVIGFETLLADSAGTYDMSILSGITTLVSGGIDEAKYGPDAWWDPQYNTDMWDTTGNAAVSFTNVQAGTALRLNTSNTGSVSYALAANTAADSVAIELGNTSDNNLQDVTVNAVTVDDIETVTIDSLSHALNPANTMDAVDDNEITTLNASEATSITITGEANTTIDFVAPKLSVLDASGLSANFTMTSAIGTTNGLQFQGAEGVDTYFGTLNGDTINAGTAQDDITLGAAGKTDTIILEAGDALLGSAAGTETYTNFITGEDNIDLGAFGFTGTEASALGNKGNINAQIAALTSASDDIAAFFTVAGIDRGVAISTDGANTYVLVDADHNGDLNMDTDLVIELIGTSTVTLGDFGF